MTAYSYTVGASGADYTTLTSAVAARQGTPVSGDTIEFVLLDSTCDCATFINYDRGITITVRSANKFDGRWGGGTKLTSAAHGLRFLGVNSDAGDPWQNVVCEDLWWDADDLNGYYDMTAQQPGAVARNATYRNCGFRDYKNNVNGLVFYGDTASLANTLLLENCVFWGRRERAVQSVSNTGSSQSWTVTQERCTFYDSHWSVTRNANLNLTITSRASILKPYSTAAEVVTSGSGGTLTLNSEVCAFSRSQTDVEGLWDVNDADLYAVTMVTGNPASGQIGFVDISTGDFRLYDDADNVAIDGASGVTGLPTEDIAGDPVDADPDIGAFEVQQLAGDVTVTPGIATATLTAYAPTVLAEADVVLVPGIVTATLTAQTPTVVATADVALVPGVAELVATPFAPTVAVTADVTLVPGAATATLTPFAPTLVTDVVLVPGASTATLTPFAPAIIADVGLTPGAALATLTPHAPVVLAGANQLLTPGEASLTVVPYAPTLSLTQHVFAEPAPAVVTLTPFAPTLIGGSVTVISYGALSTPFPVPAGADLSVSVGGAAATAPKLRLTLFFRARQHGYLH